MNCVLCIKKLLHEMIYELRVTYAGELQPYIADKIKKKIKGNPVDTTRRIERAYGYGYPFSLEASVNLSSVEYI